MRRVTGVLFAVSSLIAAENDWAYWRGPNRDGVARSDAPAKWSPDKAVWRAAIPGRGHSSPVVWGNRIFLTTAVPAGEAAAADPAQAGRGGGGPGGGAASGVPHKFLVMALDRNTGKPIWEQTATQATPHEGYHRQYGSFASNSPVTDGTRVYALFGSRGLYVYNLDGKLEWKREFPPMRMRLQFGEGVPLVLHEGTLYVNSDQESDSYLLALRASDGKELWRVARDEASSWSPPYIATHAGKKQLIVAASNKVRAYEPDTGKLIWECAGLGSNVIPAPVQINDTVIVMSGHRNPNLLAIKLGRTGDLTGTDAVVWTNQRGNSYTPSPVLHEGKIYMLTDNGMLSCFDALTGKAYYHQERLPQPYNFKASPVAAGGKLYLSAENGDVIVVKLGEKLEILATIQHPDEMFIASPAIVEGSLYLRGKNTLYCIR